MTEAKKTKPTGKPLATVGMMSAMGFGVIVAAPAFGLVAPFVLKGIVCFGCAWSSNETLRKFTGRIPKRLEIKTPPVVKGWSVFVGRTTGGRAVYHNFHRIPHSKVAGVTGAGKSVMLAYLVAALCMAKTPKELEVWAVDMKDGVEFSRFEHFPHVTMFDHLEDRDGKEGACTALENAVKELHRRNKIIANARKQFKPVPHFKMLLIVIDEGGELAPKFAPDGPEKDLRDKCMSHLSSIVRLGRSARVSVLYGTQRPSNETLPTYIRGLMDGTFAFRVENELDAEITLRKKETAELLPHIPGRYIYKNPAAQCEAQAPFIDDTTLEQWIRSGGCSEYINIPYGVMDEKDNPAGTTASLSISDISDSW